MSFLAFLVSALDFPLGREAFPPVFCGTARHPRDVCGKVSDFPSVSSWPERACLPAAVRMWSKSWLQEQLHSRHSLPGGREHQPGMDAQKWQPGQLLSAGCCCCSSGGTSGLLFFTCVHHHHGRSNWVELKPQNLFFSPPLSALSAL